MSPDITIRIAGEAGLGIETVGRLLCLTLRGAGLHCFANQDSMSRIRGGNNFSQIRISDRPIFAPRQRCDVILALDGTSVAAHREALADGGVLVADTERFPSPAGDPALLHVPLYTLAEAAGRSSRIVNAAAFGALVALTGLSAGEMEKGVRSLFSGKGKEIADANARTAQAGYDHILKGGAGGRFPLKHAPARPELLLTGNDAVALGAVQAGCKFYSAYPMSPSTGIMEALCRLPGEYGIVVEQAEDEIAAVNMAVGASFAGVRAMTATSGGGFALMTEGVSLAAMTETPLVAVVAQRPGPATGFPTRTEQADLAFVINGGHGEFAKAVYAPGTPEEAFSVTFQAFQIAEHYQIPALILTDQHLADATRNVEAGAFSGLQPRRHVIPREESAHLDHYQRYALTPSGISPRALPSWIPGVLYADSDEHTESGHITESADLRNRMVQKRFHNKMAGLTSEIRPPSAFNLENASTVLLGFGSTFGVIREAAEGFPGGGVGAVHFSQVWPFPGKDLLDMTKKAKRILTVENNAGGQLARLIRQETGLAVHGSILKYDGRPFAVEEITAKI